MIALIITGWVLLGLIGSGCIIYDQGYCDVFDLGFGLFLALIGGPITLVASLIVIGSEHCDRLLWEKAK